jgi:hypothetical protein
MVFPEQQDILSDSITHLFRNLRICTQVFAQFKNIEEIGLCFLELFGKFLKIENDSLIVDS